MEAPPSEHSYTNRYYKFNLCLLVLSYIFKYFYFILGRGFADDRSTRRQLQPTAGWLHAAVSE